MGDVHFETSGVKRLMADISEAGPRNRVRLSRALRKTALDLEADIKLFILQVGAVDTGNMLNGVSSDIKPFWAEIGPTADYSHFVNGGTSKMAPRPFMEPAARRQLPRLAKAVRDVGGDIL